MITCLCLHPSIDRTVELSAPLAVGELQRATRVWERAGGKGVNVASVLRYLGQPSLTVLAVAGANGTRLEGLLLAQGIPHRALTVSGQTRECHTFLDGGAHPTEINESGPDLTLDDLSALEELIPAQSTQLVVSGSLAPGLHPSDFRNWLAGLKTRYRVAVDTSGAALRAALEAGVTLVKPNTAELQTLGLSALEVFERYGVEVLHSRGHDGLLFVGAAGRFTQAAFEVRVVNPVGAGDATLAGFVAALEGSADISKALRWAAACGAAACLEPMGGVIDPRRVEDWCAPEAARG